VDGSFAAVRKGGRTSVRDEGVKLLHSRGRVEVGVRVEREADIANLRAAV
jgi:hypothetical protein